MHEEIRKAVCNANIELQTQKLVICSWGNVSGIDRAAGVVAIKPSGVPYDQLTPGKIVLIDLDGKIVEGAILEIKDPQGRPARALKTNMLGHFMIVTPLLDGRYEILAEKEGLVFEPVTFSAKGAIIPPISIWAKSREETLN